MNQLKLNILSLLDYVTMPLTGFFVRIQEKILSLKIRASGMQKTEINTCSSDNSIQNLTCVFGSKTLTKSCLRKVQRLTETFVKDVEEALSKASSGNTAKRKSRKSG